MKFKRKFLSELLRGSYFGPVDAPSYDRGYDKEFDAFFIARCHGRDIFRFMGKFYCVAIDELQIVNGPEKGREERIKAAYEEEIECLECNLYEIVICHGKTIKVWLPISSTKDIQDVIIDEPEK